MIKPAVNLQTLADNLLLQQFSPPAVLTNETGDILYISGKTGKYLETAAGQANRNICPMPSDGIRSDLGSALQRAYRPKEAVTVKGLTAGKGTSLQTVDITVEAIEEPEALRGMVMIVFRDVPPPLQVHTAAKRSSSALISSTRVLELEQEQHQFREMLQANREEMQSSQEELKSANEELQSTNEELQSTNEELTTSREEMQSLNEELQTVNAEQQSKMDELARVNNDMRNLLNSTEIVTVFLDNDLHIRRFTSGADTLFRLRTVDIGRSLSEIVNDLNYPDIITDSREVHRTLIFSEKQITTIDGRWFSVRIMPYRTMDDVISGVVITFANITAAKTLEAELRAENVRLKAMLEAKD